MDFLFHYTPFKYTVRCKRNSKIPKGQSEIVISKDRQEHGQRSETKNGQRTHNTTLKTEAGVTRTLQNQGVNDHVSMRFTHNESHFTFIF